VAGGAVQARRAGPVLLDQGPVRWAPPDIATGTWLRQFPRACAGEIWDPPEVCRLAACGFRRRPGGDATLERRPPARLSLGQHDHWVL